MCAAWPVTTCSNGPGFSRRRAIPSRASRVAMSLPPEFVARVAEFPAVLRELIEAELAAGNEIVELASCFPAPPVGAYVKLAKPVTTRPREKTGTLDFYDRNSSIYSGEWTDAKRFFFVLEPPHPPPPEPDMDAIRDASNAATQNLPALQGRNVPTAVAASAEAGPKSLVRR